MTGLDHTSDVIVEIATLITDDDLEIVAEGPGSGRSSIRRRPSAHGSVRDRHAHEVGPARADPCLDHLARAGRRRDAGVHQASTSPSERAVPLCGNSIGTDRRFLAAYLPDIENHLHYRSVDVSSIKELVRAVVPRCARPPRPRRQGAHRALDDIRESVSELKVYRDLVFRNAAEVAALLGATAEPEEETEPADTAGSPDVALPDDRMRAVVVTEYGGPEVLTLAEVPEPSPGPDEILVRVAHSACNRADTLQRQGGYRDPERREHEILGLEYAGTVEAVGARRHVVEAGRSGDGHRVGGVLRRTARHPRPSGAPDPRHDRAHRCRRDARGVPHRMGCTGGAGRAHERAVGAGPRRRVGRGHRRHPDREGDRRADRRHLLGRQGGGLSRAGCRSGARAQSADRTGPLS